MVKDENLIKIKEVIKTIFPDSRIMLFGSRGRDDFETQSDYDILVEVKENLSIKQKREYEGKIRKQLAKIPLDVIIKTEEDISYYQDKIGSVTREAILNGVNL